MAFGLMGEQGAESIHAAINAVCEHTIDTIDSVPWIGNNATCAADPRS